MNCAELDNLRNQGRGLSPGAQQHLQDCEACRNLQEIWDAPDDGVEVPADLQAHITNAILAELRPISPLHSDGLLFSTVLFLAALVVAVGAAWLGVAGWRALALWQAVVIFALLAAGLIVMARVVTRQMVPGASQPFSSGAAIFGIGAALLTAILFLFPYAHDAQFVARGAKCWAPGMLSALAAWALFAAVLRRGARLHPMAQGAATGLLSGLVGLSVLEIYCPYLDRAHRGFWHFGAALTAVLLGLLWAALSEIVRKRGVLTGARQSAEH